MRFGLLCSPRAGSGADSDPPGQGLRDWIAFNEEAERLGYFSTFLVEHHFSGLDQVSATLTMLAALATRTTRLRLGSGVLALPWHNPVMLAEQVATVDLLSAGRLDLGVGRGYRHPEFSGFGVDPAESEARFDEAVEVLRRSWTSSDPFSHSGAFWRFNQIVVEPNPVQTPHPPIWMAAGSDRSAERAGAAGHRLILDQYASPGQIASRIGTYRDRLTSIDFDPLNVAVARYVRITDSDAETAVARRELADANQRIIEVSRDPDDRMVGSHVLAHRQDDGPGGQAFYGSPEQIVHGLQTLHHLGVAYVLLILPPTVTQLRRFRDEVIPHLPSSSTETPPTGG